MPLTLEKKKIMWDIPQCLWIIHLIITEWHNLEGIPWKFAAQGHHMHRGVCVCAKPKLRWKSHFSVKSFSNAIYCHRREHSP